MRRFIAVGVLVCALGSAAVGATRAGVIIGPGPGLGNAMLVPDARALDPGHAQEKEAAKSSVRNLLDRGAGVLSKTVKLYKFTKFPVPISDLSEADSSLLKNCSPEPARYMGTHAESKVTYFLVVMDCPTEADPQHQVAAAVGERNSKVVSIVINADTIPVAVPDQGQQPDRGR